MIMMIIMMIIMLMVNYVGDYHHHVTLSGVTHNVELLASTSQALASLTEQTWPDVAMEEPLGLGEGAVLVAWMSVIELLNLYFKIVPPNFQCPKFKSIIDHFAYPRLPLMCSP